MDVRGDRHAKLRRSGRSRSEEYQSGYSFSTRTGEDPKENRGLNLTDGKRKKVPFKVCGDGRE